MKKTVVLMSFFASLTSLAQNTSVSTIGQEVSSKGFRMSLSKPSLTAEIKASANGKSASNSQNLSDSLGLGIGYASLPVQQLGWTSNLSLIEIKEGGTTVQLTRLDGNLAFAFTPVVNVKGGLNLAKMTKGDEDGILSPAFGLQVGVGFQVNKNFGIDVGYTQMNQKAEVTSAGQDVDLNLAISGVEIGINGTF